MLFAPTHQRTGHPIKPTRQLLAQWIVEAWVKVSEDLVANSWTCCGYKLYDVIRSSRNQQSSAIAIPTTEQVGTIIEKTAGSEARMFYDFFDALHGDEEPFDDIDDD
eukprot:1139522-Ditylum_brightwellii.AAC.1